MKVKTPDNITEENVRSNFRNFDSECFDPDDVGTWDLDSVEEIDEDEFDETKSYHCNVGGGNPMNIKGKLCINFEVDTNKFKRDYVTFLYNVGQENY